MKSIHFYFTLLHHQNCNLYMIPNDQGVTELENTNLLVCSFHKKPSYMYLHELYLLS